ncbi:hypothetical protein GALL_532860 [mine drainage metagenome]|uniref:Uncharacterized protein n=1 Tax=mine drainage metagenome TaxID=410659 RepID=A0A1J5PBI6_9ZZZZ
MDRLAHRVVATEAETHVTDTTADLGTGQVGLDPARGVDEIDRVVVVLLNAGGNGKDVGVKNDVFGRKTDLIDQDAVSPLANLDLALVGVGLALLVKRHHHSGSTIAAQQFGVVLEGIDTFLHADRVDHGFALHAAQAGLDDAPFA